MLGGSLLLGVFTDENKAKKAAIGRGNLDCGGDGVVLKRKGMINDGEAYLFELDFPIKCDEIVSADPRVVYKTFHIKVCDIYSPIDFMRILRKRTGWSLQETKYFYDDVKNNGGSIIESTHRNINGTVDDKEFLEWKQEMVGYASLEAV